MTHSKMSSERMAETIFAQIREVSCEHSPMLIALDGRSASGKTTVAALVRERLQQEGVACEVVHMDDFFLQPNQRTSARLAEPGGNVDYERVEDSVLQPAKHGGTIVYRRFDCGTMSLGEEHVISPQEILLVEGAYSCHPKLRDYFDLRIFLSIDPKTQMQRIVERNGEERAAVFRDRWIPLEETYIAQCQVEEACELHLRVEDVESALRRERF